MNNCIKAQERKKKFLSCTKGGWNLLTSSFCSHFRSVVVGISIHIILWWVVPLSHCSTHFTWGLLRGQLLLRNFFFLSFFSSGRRRGRKPIVNPSFYDTLDLLQLCFGSLFWPSAAIVSLFLGRKEKKWGPLFSCHKTIPPPPSFSSMYSSFFLSFLFVRFWSTH